MRILAVSNENTDLKTTFFSADVAGIGKTLMDCLLIGTSTR